jgi:hypothetical protein
MTDRPQEDVDRTKEEREAEKDDLLEKQEHKGYGEDEGERNESLPPE